MTFVDAVNEVRVSLDHYARARTDASFMAVLTALDELRRVHDAGTLARSLERRRQVALARAREAARR